MGLSKERGLYFQEKWEEMQYRFANIEMKREIERLNYKLQQKENIIKEVREILNQDKASASFNTAERIALEILDKDGDKNEPNE